MDCNLLLCMVVPIFPDGRLVGHSHVHAYLRLIVLTGECCSITVDTILPNLDDHNWFCGVV